MRKTFSFFVLIFSIYFSNITLSNESIYYIDLDFVMNNSLAGKSLAKQLDKKSKSYSEKFKKTESSLKEEESKLVAQKKIIDKEDFDKKVILFTQKVSKYKKERSDILNNLSKQKIKAQKILINKLTPILADYAKKNSISFILPKQSIIVGKTELDLTKSIIEILNEQVKSLNLE